MKQKKRINDDCFISLNQDNFHIKWEYTDYGVHQGVPICSSSFGDLESAKAHFYLTTKFLEGLLERNKRFVELNEQRNWIDIRTRK